MLLGDLVVPWVLAWLVGHWSLSPLAKADRKLMLQFFGLGLFFEWLHQATGLLTFSEHSGPLPPLWIVCLWPLFATLLLHSLGWLMKRPKIGMALVALGGWGSYLGGAQLANAELNWPGSLLLLVEWGFLYWLCLNYLIPNALKNASN